MTWTLTATNNAGRPESTHTGGTAGRADPAGPAGRAGTDRTAAIRSPRSALDWAQATALLHDYVEWLRAAVGVEPLDEQPSMRTELGDMAAAYDGASSRLFLAFDGPMAVGMVGVRHHEGGSSELKRMYLRPVARGRGLADALVQHVLVAAAEEGRRAVWLETMRHVMEPALAVYRRHGFEPRTELASTIPLEGMVVLECGIVPEPGR